MDPLAQRIESALADSSAMGELPNADRIGTAGSEACGDLLRIWLKFREEKGRRVIDQATYQTFGCQTALAVASVAAKLLQGRTPEEALALSGEDLAAPLGELPPMKIHCAQLVESALKDALSPFADNRPTTPPPATQTGHPSGLLEDLGLTPSAPTRNIKIIPTNP
jgi:NifU-like protein involved in Fe-S cluster formation